MLAADTIASVHEPFARSDAAYALSVDISSIASEAGASSREWRPAPGELVSLWDMQQFDVHSFIRFKTYLLCMRFAWSERSKGGDGPGTPEKITEDKRQALPVLAMLESLSVVLGLDSAVDQIKRIRDDFDSPSCTYESLSILFQDLINRIDDRLIKPVFMFMADDEVVYWNDPLPLGQKVSNEMPEVTEDAAEASRCLGVRRYSAAVFHLMRVMEVGVHHLVKLLALTVNTDQPWGVILKSVDDAIAQLPGGASATPQEKARKSSLSEAAVFLRHVKDAWRNNTMHPKRTYTEEEAKRIFESVKTFMRYLVELK